MGEVYVLTCKRNQKQYVGMTRGTAQWRYLGHIEAAANGSKQKLHKAMRRYGPDQFSIEIVYLSNDPKKLFQKEAEWIYKLDTFENGLNMTRGNNVPARYRRDALQQARRRIRKRLGRMRRRRHVRHR